MVQAADFAKTLQLTVLSPSTQTEWDIRTTDLNRPGMQFCGFYEYFPFERPQVIGKVEMTYLENLEPEVRRQMLKKYFSFDIPCVIICRGMHPPEELLEAAAARNIAVYQTGMVTTKFFFTAINYLNRCLAPRVTRHGVLVSVYGMGVLITGDSGVGKSEAALELIRRGHQLVADDVVDICRVSDNRLTGECPEMVRHFMEIRGIGIIDIRAMYGIGAVAQAHHQPRNPAGTAEKLLRHAQRSEDIGPFGFEVERIDPAEGDRPPRIVVERQQRRKASPPHGVNADLGVGQRPHAEHVGHRLTDDEPFEIAHPHPVFTGSDGVGQRENRFVGVIDAADRRGGLTVTVFQQSALLQHERHGLHARNASQRRGIDRVGRKGLPLPGRDGQIGVEGRTHRLDETLEAVEDREQDDHRRNGHRNGHNAQPRNQIDNRSGFGREEVAAGEELRQHGVRPEGLVVFERLLDMVDILQRIVEKELDFGHVLDLIADALAQSVADELVVAVKLLHQCGAAPEGEDADVNLGVTEIGRHAHGRDRDERTPDDALALLLKDFGDVLLYLFGDFLLSCRFHDGEIL